MEEEAWGCAVEEAAVELAVKGFRNGLWEIRTVWASGQGESSKSWAWFVRRRWGKSAP